MKEYKCVRTHSRYHVLTRLFVTENHKTVAILRQSRLATVPVSPSVVGLTYIGTHALTPVITLSMTDVDTDAGTHTQLLLISLSTSLRYSLTRAPRRINIS